MSKVLPSENTYNSYCELKLKQNKNRMITRIIVVVVIWALIAGFLFSPLSKARIHTISGNALNFNEEYIYKQGNFSRNSFIWHNDYKKIAKDLSNHRYLKNITFTPSLFGLNIEVDEVILVGKSNDSDVSYYMSDGTTISASSIEDKVKDPHQPEQIFIGQYKNSVPLIDKSGYTSDESARLVKELGHMDHSLLLKVNDIKCNKTYDSFNVSTFTFAKEDVSLNKDLIINVDTRQIDELLYSKIIDQIIGSINDQNNCYNYFIDTKDDKIVCYPLDK